MCATPIEPLLKSGDIVHYYDRTLVEVSRIPRDAQFEIEAIAAT